ncbi:MULTISPECIES: hypothetical protein [unclassified Duganella]|uniref:hypothetical protein n=1 Tax=unclassified Duganella TaxID=2636909 RepID=UPI00088807D6|nr:MULTISPECIES: hypothetical protein [unclassified Duganella]SDG16038.1 hypothetical protein SAMN05216320_10393 [Duganella sp. OV458]SDJ31926.1 hypothetical protein SAMN05428973_103393 [Duganella sp. OV510]
MKFSFVSAAAALAMIAALAGCGGKQQYTVQGTISGLNNSGLVLTNNGGDDLSVPIGATSFAFPKQIGYGTTYNVAIKSDPAHMTCNWNTANVGSAGYNVSIQMALVCSQNSYSLGGQISGLTAAADGTARSITLTNGSSGSVTISSGSATNGAADFVIGTVADGQSYGVTFVDSNNGLTCSVTNGVGIMHETAISNIVVVCTNK